MLNRLELNLEDRACKIYSEEDVSETEHIDPTLLEQEWTNEDWQNQNDDVLHEDTNVNTLDDKNTKVDGDAGNATFYGESCLHGDAETDDDKSFDSQAGSCEVQLVEDDYHELLRQNDLEEDPSLAQNRFFVRKTNEHRSGWLAPTAHEARVLANPDATIVRPIMPFKKSKTSSRKYRPQITKDIVMRVLGLDSNEYCNLCGSVRRIVQTHGLNSTGKASLLPLLGLMMYRANMGEKTCKAEKIGPTRLGASMANSSTLYKFVGRRILIHHSCYICDSWHSGEW